MTIGKSSFVESWFSIHEETQEIEILGGVKAIPECRIANGAMSSNNKKPHFIYCKTTLRNIMQTLQKHYASL